MNSRTIRDFSVPTDIWPAVTQWAETEGFRLIDDSGSKRRYQKGVGLLVLPTMLEISQNDGNVHLETWIQCSPINRLFSLFMLPEEITLESGGMRAVIPRTISLDSVNRLMIKLGQPMLG